jgi:hypothetical protein
MKRYSIYALFAVLTAAMAVSCEKERDLDGSVNGRDAIRFTSFRRQVFTRADIDQAVFAEGTAYTLLAVGHKESAAAYNWATDAGFVDVPETGVETAAHAIQYEPTAMFPKDADLDFFALTYGNTTAPSLDSAPVDGAVPTITLTEAGDRLADLQHSNSVKERTSAGGTVILPFDHALAAVNFLIAKQDESGDAVSDRQLEAVRVTSIKLENVAEEATMDIASGEWSWTAAHVGNRSVFSDGDGVALTTSATAIGEEDLLVFPNSDGDKTNNVYDPDAPFKYYTADGDECPSKGEQVIIKIALEGLQTYDFDAGDYVPMEKTLQDGTVVSGGRAEVSFPLRLYDDRKGLDAGPMLFERNHKYTLSIFVMRDNVRIVAVSPQVYKWEDVKIAGEAEEILGQPVTFGGIVWMDRNLGASSADCENDWWHSCGYFYQFGRNIPYIINLDDILAADGKSEKPDLLTTGSHSFTKTASSPSRGTTYFSSKGFYLFYTFNEKGEKVYDWYGGTNYIYEPNVENRTLSDRTYVAIRPGEKGFYGMMAGGSNTSTWARNASGSAEPKNGSFWLDPANLKKGNPENQPVPKGWRMPTRADGYKILPEPAQNARSWMEYAAYLFQGRISDLDQNISGDVNKLSYVLGDDNYRYQYVRGRIYVKEDETPDADGLTSIGVYSSSVPDASAAPCIYGIKRQGTPEAYRIMIKRMKSNVTGRYFLRISQFPSNENEIFRTSVDKTGTQNSKALSYNGTAATKWNLQEFDWEHPSGVLDFPLQGYIDAGGDVPYWNQIGICTIMRLPEYESSLSSSTNWTFYMRNATSGVAVGAASRRALGDCIRLVRDMDAD